MGSEQFSNYQPGADAPAAFASAVDSAAFEHGHGGYTGTLAEKHRFTIITPTPQTRAEARTLVRQLLEIKDARVDDKWGPAGAIPIRADDGTDTIGWVFFGWASS